MHDLLRPRRAGFNIRTDVHIIRVRLEARLQLRDGGVLRTGEFDVMAQNEWCERGMLLAARRGAGHGRPRRQTHIELRVLRRAVDVHEAVRARHGGGGSLPRPEDCLGLGSIRQTNHVTFSMDGWMDGWINRNQSIIR